MLQGIAIPSSSLSLVLIHFGTLSWKQALQIWDPESQLTGKATASAAHSGMDYVYSDSKVGSFLLPLPVA